MILKNGKKLEIDDVKIEDAKELIDYTKIVIEESENLSMGAGDFNMSLAQEEGFISSIQSLDNSFMLIARIDSEIVGTITIIGNERKRIKHHSELGISVKKKYWNHGVASVLVSEAIEKAKSSDITEIINLSVRSDNHHAIKLYEKFGFKKTGVFERFFKINGAYYDVVMMNLYFENK